MNDTKTVRMLDDFSGYIRRIFITTKSNTVVLSVQKKESELVYYGDQDWVNSRLELFMSIAKKLGHSYILLFDRREETRDDVCHYPACFIVHKEGAERELDDDDQTIEDLVKEWSMPRSLDAATVRKMIQEAFLDEVDRYIGELEAERKAIGEDISRASKVRNMLAT